MGWCFCRQENIFFNLSKIFCRKKFVDRNLKNWRKKLVDEIFLDKKSTIDELVDKIPCSIMS